MGAFWNPPTLKLDVIYERSLTKTFGRQYNALYNILLGKSNILVCFRPLIIKKNNDCFILPKWKYLFSKVVGLKLSIISKIDHEISINWKKFTIPFRKLQTNFGDHLPNVLVSSSIWTCRILNICFDFFHCVTSNIWYSKFYMSKLMRCQEHLADIF